MPYCYLNVFADVNNFYLPTPIILSGDFQNLRHLVKSLSSTFISECDKTKRSMYLFVAPLAQVINRFEEAGFIIFSINKNDKRNIWILHKEDKRKRVFKCKKHVDIALSTEDLVIEDGLTDDCIACKLGFPGGSKNKILPYRSEPLVLCSNQSQRKDQNCSYQENNHTRKRLDQDAVVNCTDAKAIPSIITMMNVDENKYPENYQVNCIETVPAHNDNIICIPSTNLLNQCATVAVSRDQENSSGSIVVGGSYDPILVEDKPTCNLPRKPAKIFLNKEICARETSIDNNLVRMIIEKNNLPRKRSNLLPNENLKQREEKSPRLKIYDSSESTQTNNQPASPGIKPKFVESLNIGLPKKVTNEESTKFQNEIISKNEEIDAPTKDTKQTRVKNINSTVEADSQTESDQSKGESKFEKVSLSAQSTEYDYQSETQNTIRTANENFAQNFSKKSNLNETNKFNRESELDLEAMKIIKKYQEKYKNNDCNTSYGSPSRESSYSYYDTRSNGSLSSSKDVDITENDKCETLPSKESLIMSSETMQLATDETEILQRNQIELDKKPKYIIKEINSDRNNPTSHLSTLNKTFKNPINDKTKTVSVKSVSADDKNYLPLAQRRQLIYTVANQSCRKEFVNKKNSNFLTCENSISRGMSFDQNNEIKSPFNSKFRVQNVQEKTRSMTFSRLHTKNVY